MSVIRWEDPGPAWAGQNRTRQAKRSQHWAEVAEQLRERPGRWALVLEDPNYNYAGGMSGQIKRANIAAFRPAGTFDAVYRSTDGIYRVYARYIGGES